MNASSNKSNDISLLVANVNGILNCNTTVEELTTTCLQLIHGNNYSKDFFRFLVNRKTAIFFLDLIIDNPTENQINA